MQDYDLLGPGPPVLVLMKGHPGSGKSTLARALARHLRCPLVDKDDARDVFEAHVAAQPRENGGARAADCNWNELSYAVMFQVAGTQLSLGLHVVVDCPLARAQLYEDGLAVARKHGARVCVLECVCGDAAVWRQRLEARGAQQSGAAQGHKPCTWRQLQDLLAGYSGSWEWPSTMPGVRLVTVDTSACDEQAADATGSAGEGREQHGGQTQLGTEGACSRRARHAAAALAACLAS
ncbi:hypothetical protein FOA52_011084 [Chlamydomonas sp. UWO 241]|nr:hypothetical protein FOA52_011084 [Chlamydomonas sp. UWO 241]